MVENAEEDKISDCVNELGFEIEAEGPEEEQLKTDLICLEKIGQHLNCIEAIIFQNARKRSAQSKFREIYDDYVVFRDQVRMGQLHGGLHLIELQKTRGVKNQDLIDYML